MRCGNLTSSSAPSCSTSEHVTRRSCRMQGHVRGRLVRSRAVERDLDWEPDLKAPAAAPPGSKAKNYMPPPPPRPPPTADIPFPFRSRREIGVTMLGGSVAYWLLQHKVLMPIDSFGDKPPIDFTLAGYTDLSPEEFIYFKTPAGRWMAAAEDDQGRFFMIDEVGDLYYDSGNPDIGLYAMDTQGNLFNFYIDTDGQQKITPVGNVADLRKFKIEEIAGIQLDRDVNVVAFRDGTTAPLPPGSEFTDPITGQLRGPDELVEGINSQPYLPSVSEEVSSRRNLFQSLFNRKPAPGAPPVTRFEVDLNDPRDYEEQMVDQSFWMDPDNPEAPLLPENFDFDELVEEVKEEAKYRKR